MNTLNGLNRESIEKALESDYLAPHVRRVLELRLDGGQAAVKKLDALLTRAGADDRVRGSFRYHGAATGRWSGEGPQPQNMKRPEVADIEAAIAAVATGDYAYMKSLYPRPLAVVGDCTRSTITAPEGYDLLGGDLSSIEGRITAWVAGEVWKVNAYRKYDETGDPRDEPYCVTACRIFRKPESSFDKKSPERKVGKTCELAFGYQGGLRAWRNFEPDQFSDAEVETFKNEWRAAHPNIVRFWNAIDAAAVSAVAARGNRVRCGWVYLVCEEGYLKIILPSGRAIHYPLPYLTQDAYGRSRVVFSDNANGQFVECRGGAGAYGGLWTENIVQGIARDILAEALIRIDAAGYAITMHVHDEIVCEVPIGQGNVEKFVELLTRNPSWAPDLPISAEGWIAPRYRK